MCGILSTKTGADFFLLVISFQITKMFQSILFIAGIISFILATNYVVSSRKLRNQEKFLWMMNVIFSVYFDDFFCSVLYLFVLYVSDGYLFRIYLYCVSTNLFISKNNFRNLNPVSIIMQVLQLKHSPTRYWSFYRHFQWDIIHSLTKRTLELSWIQWK